MQPIIKKVTMTSKQTLLVDAAYRLLCQQPACQLTYQAVAREAGLMLSNCYRHYRSLPHLLRHLSALRVQIAFESFPVIAPTKQVSIPRIIKTRCAQLAVYFNAKPIDCQLLFSRANAGVIMGCEDDIDTEQYCVIGYVGELLVAQLSRRFDIADSHKQAIARFGLVTWPLWSFYYNRDSCFEPEAVDDISQLLVSYASYFIPALPPSQVPEPT